MAEGTHLGEQIQAQSQIQKSHDKARHGKQECGSESHGQKTHGQKTHGKEYDNEHSHDQKEHGRNHLGEQLNPLALLDSTRGAQMHVSSLQIPSQVIDTPVYEDIQRKATHTPRFYQPILTPKQPVESSPWQDVATRIAQDFSIEQSYIELGICVFWVRKDDVYGILSLLKVLGYEILSDMSAVDLLADEGYFEMFYELHSIKEDFKHKRRIRIKCQLGAKEQIASESRIFSLALWSEREAYDMLGIEFINHPNLTRLIMPRDWVGHPLRRSYPLQGDEHASWYEIDKIFGREYRQVVGPEQRDSARVDEHDPRSFSKIDAIGEESEGLYMEASKALFVKNIAKAKKVQLERRK